MKYGIYCCYWLKEMKTDYKYLIDKVANLGFDNLEISCATFDESNSGNEQLSSLGEYAKEHDIMLTAGYGPEKNHNIGSSASTVVNNAKAYYKKTFKKLSLLDIHFLGGGLYSYWPIDYSLPVDKVGDWKRSVENMREIAKMAQEYNIILGMEVLNRFEGYLLNTCKEAMEYISEVNMPNVKIMLDTFHMNIEEDNIGAAMRLAGENLCHLHIGEQNRKVPGKGSIPWNEVGQALRDINYKKAVVMEPFVLQGGTIGDSVKVWRNLITDTSEAALDRDAKDALAFVKQVFEA